MAPPLVHVIALEGKKVQKGKAKWLKHYSSEQSILIVGDGDFSFSLALATAFGSAENLVATSLDSYGALICKHHQAGQNVRELKRMGATILHDVDANDMKLHDSLKMRRFERIVFNFPHAGFSGQETQRHVIKLHLTNEITLDTIRREEMVESAIDLSLYAMAALSSSAWEAEDESALVIIVAALSRTL